MNRTLLGIAAVIAALALLVFSGAALLRSVAPAQAQDFGSPMVTGGSQPYLSFYGTHRRNVGDSVKYTVPAGYTFVLTAACMSDYITITQDGAYKFGEFTNMTESGTAQSLLCGSGAGRIPFPAGSTVGIIGTCPECSSSSNYEYFFQGHLIHQ